LGGVEVAEDLGDIFFVCGRNYWNFNAVFTEILISVDIEQVNAPIQFFEIHF